MPTLAGVGSLVSESSARKSFAFSNFRLGEVRGWRRSFNQANWVNISRGLARPETGEVAALSMIPADAFVSKVALMDVDETGLRGFYEREAGYRIVRVQFAVPGFSASEAEKGEALLCTACRDDVEADALWAQGGEMEQNCAGSTYVRDWMRRSLRPLWPTPPSQPMSLRTRLPDGREADFLDPKKVPLSSPMSNVSLCDALYPSPGYLKGCAAAHQRAGLIDHFLDSTVLHDGKTVLRAYLEANPQLAAYVASGYDADKEES
eukprot:gnl/TRDRNA2_/TRDRNA2_175579_c7_seq11.p1 gnl/TRDRNA2_/TRDRNA2_175579_c7~~gnl/TRDRNA2_/TRDRNA2_175579_c7_seq11.p1  ORF type:complete len:263 (-),score=45.94 gnl/TRDRNA2_/TRDRNA2_175579_c7_seq11:747-1535(-)